MAKKWEDKKDDFDKIQLIPEAAEEYNNLDGSIKIEVDNKPLEKEAFEEEEGTSILEFSSRDDKKLDVTYKFRYKKS